MMGLLGAAVGAVVALPFARWARRLPVGTRSSTLRRARPAPTTSRVRLRAHLGAVGPIVSAGRERRERRRGSAALRRELPGLVDLIGVAVAAGCTPFLAVEHVGNHGSGPAAAALRGVRDACALGQSFDAALRDLGRRQSVLQPLVDTLRTSARLGAPAGPALTRVAAEVRADLRRRAEARARTVPVRLCFPLVACILPAFALLTVAPAVLGGMPT